MTIQTLINKSILKPDPVRDNMDGTYSIKIKANKKNAVRSTQWNKYAISHCDVCGNTCPKRLDSKPSRTYCTLICHSKMQREMNRRSKYQDNNGWRTKDSYHGYMVKRIWDNPFFTQGEWATQHRYNMAMLLGRKLLKSEVVHHIDMNKRNNNINNLWLCNSSQHQIAHMSFNMLCAEAMSRPVQFKFNIETGKYYLINKEKNNDSNKKETR